MKKHTKETCLKIVGYPEWWENYKLKNRMAATVVGIPQTTSSSSGDTKERKKQNHKFSMEEQQSLMEVRKERRH